MVTTIRRNGTDGNLPGITKNESAEPRETKK